MLRQPGTGARPITLDRSLYILRLRDPALVYVENPKAGSTSIHALFLALGKVESPLPARDVFDTPAMATSLKAAGLDRLRIGADELSAFAEANRNACWFSVVRDPYRRTISNYFDKLSRYTLRFDKGTYWYGKFRQILRGPNGWAKHTVGIHYMQQRLTLDDFVAGLEHHGVSFDRHFDVQARQLRVGELPYGALIKLAELRRGLGKVLDRVGVTEWQGYLDDTKRLNATSYAQPPGSLLSAEAKAGIRRLYRADFEAFGFPT